MTSPLPGPPYDPGAQVLPAYTDDWPGQQGGAAIRELSPFSQVLKQAFVMPWKHASVLLVWGVLMPAGVSLAAYGLMAATTLGAQSNFSRPEFDLLGFLAGIVNLFVAFVVSSFVSAFAAEYIRSRCLGYRSGAREIWSSISRVIWRIMGYSVLMGLILSFGAIIVAVVIALIFGFLFTVTSGGPAALLIGLALAAVIVSVAAFFIWFSPSFKAQWL